MLHRAAATHYDVVAAGEDAADPQPGDFILCHRRGFVASMIRWGERIRFRSGDHWSHVAFVEGPQTLIEALTRGVTRTPISAYRDIEYVLVKTDLEGEDVVQAVGFAHSCLGDRYGWLTILGIAISILGPRWLSLTDGSTKICSGLVANTQIRGWRVYELDPASLSPAQLAIEHNAPARGPRR